MSSRLIKNGSPIDVVGDEVVLYLRIYKSGKVQLQAPEIHPRDVCKMLGNLMQDITYAALQPVEVSKIQPPTTM
jgi:hypothetical protein